MKTDFSKSPAMNFLSSSEETTETAPAPKVDATAETKQATKSETKKEVKIMISTATEKRENKTKQVHLLLTPSNFKKLSKLAKDSGRSNNDFINYLIESLTSN